MIIRLFDSMVLNSYYNKSFYDWWGLTPPAWGTGLCLLAGFRLAGFRLPVKTMEKDKGVALQASCHGPARGLSQDLNRDMISRNGRKCSKEKKIPRGNSDLMRFQYSSGSHEFY